MIKKMNAFLLNKKGMTLVELLTAFSILTLMIFCFAPLMLSYLQTVNISGEVMERVYEKSSALEVLLGGQVSKTGYAVSLDTVPIQLTSPDATVTVDGNTQNVASATVSRHVKAYGLSSGGTFAKDPSGNPTDDGTIDISTGYATFYTDEFGSSSGIKLFPSSLTDDFQVAYITIYGDGINFTLSECNFVTTGPSSEIALTKGVDYDLEYHPDFADDPTMKTRVLLLTVYGGGDKISFETSPLVFKHHGQRYEIQIDAPMMIMVGEKSLVADDEGNEYHYYVSRGEVDKEGYLLIHRRVMETTNDPHDGGTVKLTAPMNDVEWVPAESADSYSKDSSGDSYGYYVMCGDNGQVRRFWKRADTTILSDGKTVPVDGNYYWGGDYTYYTDYDFVQVNASDGSNINSTDKNGNAYADRIYSTDTSFKFIAQRDATNTQSGFNVGSKEYTVVGAINTSTALLRVLSVVSVTRADDGEFYGRDGEIYFYELNGNNIGVYPTVTEARNKASSFGGYSVTQWVNTIGKNTGNPAHGWLETKPGSYFDVNGIDTSSINTDSYPITLTSVDAIMITGTGGSHKSQVTASSEGSYYFTSTGDGDTTAEGATTNMNYPQESYTLYCGYIPAMMDLFASRTGSTGSYNEPVVWKGTYGHEDDSKGTFYEIPTASGLTRAGNRRTVKNNIHLYTFWRMTLGITPYLTSGTELNIDTTKQGNLAFYRESGDCDEYLVHYPYTNLQYAITGKFYDQETFTNNRSNVEALFKNAKNDTYEIASPNILINQLGGAHQNVTNGEIVDITVSYLSHPFAIAVAANPTDDVVYDLANNKDGGQIFYWHNRRETITFLDSASTMVPSGENDIPVSLMVGYLLGGTVEYGPSGDKTYVNVGSVMNNGIVFLRAGEYEVKKQNAANAETYEYQATDKTGYQLSSESNVFHQFYYLNSRAKLPGSILGIDTNRADTGHHGEYSDEPTKNGHIGNLYGADYWQNNRHIQYRSLTGSTAADKSTASSSYEYIRSHPMTNTKVNCVTWGTTWNGYPEAMWGTENGTVLSWWVNTSSVATGAAQDWNDRSVDAEIQSYKWVDNVNGVTFAVTTDEYKDTVGSALWGSGSTSGATFTPGSDRFKYFYDKGTQETGAWGSVGFINTLETINDIEFADDIWIAAGDQSDKAPADYSASGSVAQSDSALKANEYRRVIRAYSDYPSNTGRNGSWINVRYWVDLVEDGSNAQTDSNSTYHWRAVQISKQSNYNIVQINCVNGMWIATGYVDGTNGGSLNDEYDVGEKTVICWTYDPLIPCGTEGGWSEAVRMYDGKELHDMNEMGGINSCATRD